jgi:hypothetical protein
MWHFLIICKGTDELLNSCCDKGLHVARNATRNSSQFSHEKSYDVWKPRPCVYNLSQEVFLGGIVIIDHHHQRQKQQQTTLTAFHFRQKLKLLIDKN